MSTTQAKMEASRARRLAEKVRERLAPACERIAVAGSIRRCGGGGEGLVGDIELVAVPRYEEPADVLPGVAHERASALDPILRGLVAAGKLGPIKGGEKYQQFSIRTVRPPIPLDLFLCRAEHFGLIYAIRTGPAGYSRRLVTPRSRGGLLAGGYRVREGRLLREITPLHLPGGREPTPADVQADGLWWEIVETPEEKDFYKHISGGWTPPEERKP